MMWHGAIGIVALLGLAWIVSENRSQVAWRVVAAGIAFQFAVAVLLLRVESVENAFEALNQAVLAVQTASQEGTSFVFGYLAGADAPFDVAHPQNSFVLAFQGLPLILLVGVLSALLFHWNILPMIVRGFAWVLRRTLGLGGAVGVSSAANVFVGMIEAPLLIRPYLGTMSRAGLFVVMTAGMATIAGNMFVLYATILSAAIPDAAGHLMTASLISAPAAIAVATLMVPGVEQDATAEVTVAKSEAKSAVEVVVNATFEGVKLVISVAAMLVVAIALVSLVNQLLALLPSAADDPISLQKLLGWAMAPVAWLLGVPWREASLAGELLASKIVLNELVAYMDLAALSDNALSPHSRLVLSYALCGFANLGSLGIMLGGLSAMVPERRDDIFALGPKSLLSGNLASFLTGAVVGLVA